MNWLQKLREDADMYAFGDVACDEHGYPDPRIPYRQPTKIGYMILVLVERIKHYPLELYCQWTDHDLEFESSIGPDSGSESWYCKRCGCGERHIYY